SYRPIIRSLRTDTWVILPRQDDSGIGGEDGNRGRSANRKIATPMPRAANRRTATPMPANRLYIFLPSMIATPDQDGELIDPRERRCGADRLSAARFGSAGRRPSSGHGHQPTAHGQW